MALATACETNDPRLVQGSTTAPAALVCVLDFPCEAACAVGFCGWQGDGGVRTTVGEVERAFARYCFEADQRLGEPAACRFFLNWFDDAPRPVVLAALGAECRAILAERAAAG